MSLCCEFWQVFSTFPPFFLTFFFSNSNSSGCFRNHHISATNLFNFVSFSFLCFPRNFGRYKMTQIQKIFKFQLLDALLGKCLLDMSASLARRFSLRQNLVCDKNFHSNFLRFESLIWFRFFRHWSERKEIWCKLLNTC